jgi:lysine 6-dehydrogenase
MSRNCNEVVTLATFGVLGSGRQGTAAAYDLAVAQDADLVVLFDADAAAAAKASARVNRLADREVARPQALDATDHDALVAALAPVTAVVCAVPYRFIPGCTAAAIESRTGMVDLGGHTATVLAQLERDPDARAADVAIVPDCGMGPGLNTTLGMYVVEQLEAAGATPTEVRLYDGGLPLDRDAPWGYRSTFDINGLTNEYDGHALFLRDGRLTPVPTLGEVETLEFEGIGPLEAFVTSGGTSTVPYSMKGRLQVYENKTLRYPGHVEAFRAFRDLGLFSEEPMEVDGCRLAPRTFYHALLGPLLTGERVEDVCLMRVVGHGRRRDEEVGLTIDLVDRHDPVTGFSAMERLTGWHAAIMAGFVADGTVEPGVHPVERAMSAGRFLEAFRGRGFEFTERWSQPAFA